MPKIATAENVSRDEMLDFVRRRHHGVFVATRGDGRPQVSPVTCGVDPQGRIAAPAEVPLGVLTALVGSPFFFWLLRRTRTRQGGCA